MKKKTAMDNAMDHYRDTVWPELQKKMIKDLEEELGRPPTRSEILAERAIDEFVATVIVVISLIAWIALCFSLGSIVGMNL